MSFTIRHFRDGAPVGCPDQATTMYAARSHARSRQAELGSSTAIILGETVTGDKKEIEVIDFVN
jgi:hypothetical protein